MSALAQPLAYTDAEVSSLLRVSKRTVYRLRKSGALRAVRIGRAVRTPAGELMRFLRRAGQTALPAGFETWEHEQVDGAQ